MPPKGKAEKKKTHEEPEQKKKKHEKKKHEKKKHEKKKHEKKKHEDETHEKKERCITYKPPREKLQASIDAALKMAKDEPHPKMRRFMAMARKVFGAFPNPDLEGDHMFDESVSQKKKDLAGKMVLLFQLTKPRPRIESEYTKFSKRMWKDHAAEYSKMRANEGLGSVQAKISKAYNESRDHPDKEAMKVKLEKAKKSYRDKIRALYPDKPKAKTKKVAKGGKKEETPAPEASPKKTARTRGNKKEETPAPASPKKTTRTRGKK